MDRAEKMDSRASGEIIFTGATTKFQLKKGLNLPFSINILPSFFEKGFLHRAQSILLPNRPIKTASLHLSSSQISNLSASYLSISSG